MSFAVNDLDALFNSAVENGARVVKPPHVLEDKDGYVRQAVIQTYGDTTHTLVEYVDVKTGQPTYRGVFLPGYFESKGRDPINKLLPAAPLVRIDHCVGNQDRDQMEDACRYYEHALGFRRFWSVDDSQVHTEYSALRSVVMASGGVNAIKMPINETAPGKKRSQVEEFVEYYDGPGVQHIALLTEDIVAAVSSMKTHRGVDFIVVPHAYYEMLALRLRERGVRVSGSEELVSPSASLSSSSSSSPSLSLSLVSSLSSARSVGDVDSLATDVLTMSTDSGSADEALSCAASETLEAKYAMVENSKVIVDAAVSPPMIKPVETSRWSFAEKQLEIPYNYVIPPSLEELERLGILVDFDENGYLLQTFTRPLGDRPTVFIEIIQRMNHNGFGAGNFRALFEAIERDQSARGNL